MSNKYGLIVNGYPGGRRRENEIDIISASSAELFFSCFLGDVELELDDISFSTRFGWVATLSFAFDIAQHVAALPRKRRSTVEFQEAEHWISLLYKDGNVYIASSYSKGIASIEYDALLELTRNGLAERLQELNTEYPGLIENAALRRQLAALEQALR